MIVRSPPVDEIRKRPPATAAILAAAMQTIVEIVIPVFGIILTGYLAGRLGVLGTAAAAALNRFIYFFALPPLLFTFTARAPVAQIFDWPFIGAFLGGTLLVFALAFAAARALFAHGNAAAIVHALAAAFANTLYMGIPLFLTAFGSGSTMPAIVASVCNLLVIGAAIAAVDVVSAKSTTIRRIVAETAGSFLRNPLLAAAAGGILFSVSGLTIPKPFGTYFDLLGAVAGPSALFAMGLSLVGQPVRSDIAEVGWLVFVKLVVHPLIVWGLAVHAFRLDVAGIESAVLLAALPSGALVYVVAQRFDILVARASTVIIVSTAASVVCVSALLVWLLGP